MDIDAFVSLHRQEWDRLDHLVRRSGKLRRLRPEEADELVDLYQRAATQLSVVRSKLPDQALIVRLTALVAGARGAVTGVRRSPATAAARFFATDMPAALYRVRWWTLAAAVLTLAVATATGAWLVHDPGLRAQLAPSTAAQDLVQHGFRGYYSDNPAAHFAAQVWTHNALITAICLASGVAFGVVPVYLLVMNGLNIGIDGGYLIAAGHGREFFTLILPHGMLELTAVFVAGGAGARLGWTLIDPGPRARLQALAEEGLDAARIVVALVLALAVSGMIEAFVTPSDWPDWARFGAGGAAWLSFTGYAVLAGRRAVRRRPAGRSAEADELDVGPGPLPAQRTGQPPATPALF